MRWSRWHLLAVALPFFAFAGVVKADTPAVTGPSIHENLAVYFIHGRSAAATAPLTLDEAMKADVVIVHETGDVNSLAIENTGRQEVFVQSGDIVKGGQQDRVLMMSFLVPPGSGRISIAAFCVEQGRWSARGAENVKQFASSEMALPMRDAKLALLTPAKPQTTPIPHARQSPAGDQALAAGRPGAAGDAVVEVQSPPRTARREVDDTGRRQQQVWANVAAAQRKLSDNLGAPVTAAASASSLQLALENQHLAAMRQAYVDALKGAASKDDIVGFVFAVGGKISGGEVYPSNALFSKMWEKQLRAAVTEAIAEKNGSNEKAPGAADVAEFLARADAAKAAETSLPALPLVRSTREGRGTLSAETRRKSGELVHRSYLAL